MILVISINVNTKKLFLYFDFENDKSEKTETDDNDVIIDKETSIKIKKTIMWNFQLSSYTNITKRSIIITKQQYRRQTAQLK